jgi:hypothetical protein
MCVWTFFINNVFSVETKKITNYSQNKTSEKFVLQIKEDGLACGAYVFILLFCELCPCKLCQRRYHLVLIRCLSAALYESWWLISFHLDSKWQYGFKIKLLSFTSISNYTTCKDCISGPASWTCISTTLTPAPTIHGECLYSDPSEVCVAAFGKAHVEGPWLLHNFVTNESFGNFSSWWKCWTWFYLISLCRSGYSRWPEPWPMTVHGHQFSLRARSSRTGANCLTRATVNVKFERLCLLPVGHPSN